MNYFMLKLPLGFETKTDIVMLSLIAIISSVLMVFVGYKLLQMLQLAGYKIKGYCRWFKETKYSFVSRLFMLTFLSTAAMLMTNVLLEEFFIGRAMSYMSFLFYILFSSLFITNLFSAKQKTPLKYTKRMTRLLVCYIILVCLLTFALSYFGFMFIPYLSFSLIGIIPLMLPLIVFLAYFITYPIEKLISSSFIKKAKKKLQNCKNLKVIGITGSYAKTSVKNILQVMLSEKYKVCATPSSYNTPLGLSKTILTKLDENDEIFIAEMGAKQKGDILELCKMVSPSVGIVTGIANQHLLTFGTIENIIKTKGELADYVQANSGNLYVNVDNMNSKLLADGYNISKKLCLNENMGTVIVENLKTNKDGSTFSLVANDKKVSCKTILLGEHNVSNIMLAANVAYDFGLSLDDISKAISKLVPITHRLEIVKAGLSYTIIDNAYNSSVEGSKASLKVLSEFEGQKIIITPGLVELGKEQFNSNFELGKDIAKVCDYVIIDSSINFKAMSSGLQFAGFDETKIIQAVSLNHAVTLLSNIVKNGDVVLFENDLPDNYS